MSLVACAGSRIDRNTVERIRAEAAAQVAAARIESEQRLAEVERQIQTLKLDLERARKDLESVVRKANDPSDDVKERDATRAGVNGTAATSFRERRSQAERQSMARVNELSRELEVLAQRAHGVGGDGRARFDAEMQRVRQQLEVVSNDLGAFDHATEQTLDSVRMRFEQDFANLRQQLDTAKRKLP
jgi:archaellum component FlaC